MKQINSQQGLSLIELMVSILISSILLLGVLQMFISTNATDRTSNELARVQESGRVALELIASEARKTGYQGCTDAHSEAEVDGVKYPDEALTGTNTSLTFNYARTGGIGNFPNTDCGGAKLSSYQISFSNCGTALCVTAADIGVNQQLVANANITNIAYLEPCGANICSKAAADADFSKTTKLQITLAVNDSRGEFAQPRTFISVIELRNRQ